MKSSLTVVTRSSYTSAEKQGKGGRVGEWEGGKGRGRERGTEGKGEREGGWRGWGEGKREGGNGTLGLWL